MASDKLDLFKVHKDEYATPKKPRLVETKPARYLTIIGQGKPGGKAFVSQAGALYNVAFTVKMSQKSAGRDYKVSKLEGLWWGSEETPTPGSFQGPLDQINWKLLIRTPDFVTQHTLEKAVAILLEKGKTPLVRDVKIETMDEGLSVQMLHVGPYAEEEQTIAEMIGFVEENGLSVHGIHHEIYLSDPNRVPEERLRTILRFPVREAKTR